MEIENMAERFYDSSDFTDLYHATTDYGIEYDLINHLKNKYNIDTVLKPETELPDYYTEDADFIGPDGKTISLDLAINAAIETLVGG